MWKKIKLSLNYKIFIWFGLAFITIILLGYETIKAYDDNLTEYSFRQKSFSNIIKLLSLENRIEDAEANQRGYLITGSSEFLNKYNQSLEDVNKDFNDLKNGLNDNNYSIHINTLDSLIKVKINRMNFFIKEKSISDNNKRLLLISGDSNIYVMESIKESINLIKTSENNILKIHTESAEGTAKYTKAILPVGLISALVFITIGYFIIRRDMLARERAEKETERIFKLSPDLLCISDKNGKFLKLNPAWEKTLGYSVQELQLKSFNDLLHPDDIETSKKGSTEVRKGKNFFLFENRYRDKTGSYKWIQWSSTFDKESGYAYSSGKDVTDTRKKEMEVRKLHERLIETLTETERIFSLSIDMLCIAGFDGYFKKLNPAWEKTLGYTLEELLSKQYIKFVHPDDVELTLQAVNDLTDEKNVFIENRYLAKNGTYKWLQWTATAVAESGLIYATAKDITNFKQKENELRTLNERLYESYKEMESFSYTVSHDLRAPLRHTIGFSQMLKKTSYNDINDDGRRTIEKIIASAEQMSKLIDDLLHYSRVGRNELKMIPVNMSLFIESIKANLPVPENKNVAWKIEKLPVIQGDPVYLALALNNLLSNAIKYSSKNENIEIEISCKENEYDYEFCVQDNGVGFDMKYIDKMFGVFQRLHSSSEFEGTGIGLAIASKVIQRHGGKIWARSEIGKGASFYFTLLKNNRIS